MKAHNGLRTQTRCTDLSKESQERFPLGNDIRGADLPPEGSARASLQGAHTLLFSCPEKYSKYRTLKGKKVLFTLEWPGSALIYESWEWNSEEKNETCAHLFLKALLRKKKKKSWGFNTIVWRCDLGAVAAILLPWDDYPRINVQCSRMSQWKDLKKKKIFNGIIEPLPNSETICLQINVLIM